ncbi:Integral membrane HRF1 family protein [Raphanus sativus]|nr:Integral membrane HRF1 family protein [Raphanus sativus]
MGPQPGMPMPPQKTPQPNPFGNPFSGPGSGLIRSGLGAYGRKYSDPALSMCRATVYKRKPYFEFCLLFMMMSLAVNLVCQGHWTRISEPVVGRLSYKPPIYDINAPDLYIPLMAFGTYLFLLVSHWDSTGSKFSPEALNWLFVKGMVGWFLQVMLLKITLLSLGSSESPLLDIVAYAGYAFAGLCLAVLGKIIWGYSYYVLIPWTCLCTGVFLVKTMKRVLFAEARSYDSSRHHYLLIFVALAQFPLLIWLGNISVNWLF